MNRIFYFWLKISALFPMYLLNISALKFSTLLSLFGYRKEVILTNLKKSFPNYSESELIKTKSLFYSHLGQIIAESIKAFNISTKEIENRVELSKVYKSSKVFALSTLADAGPMMALECIKNETPLVSFRTNISTDLVDNGKNGYITNSVEEYAEHLYSILYNDKFHMDYEYVKTFNSESSVDIKYQNFFNTLLNK